MTEKVTIKNLFLLLLFISFLLSLYSCSEQHEELPEAEGYALRINARTSEVIYSRDDDDPYVKSGIFYLSYISTANGNPYNVATVDFNREGVTPGIGIVTLPGGEELQWNNIGGDSQPMFYLDNVGATSDNPSDPMIVEFTDNNPYIAGLYQGDRNSNDLLWGSRSEKRNTGTINFDLHHNMARFRVQITVDQINGDIDMNGAKVEITSLAQTPSSFNRQDGTLYLVENYSSLTLVDDRENDLDWDSIEYDGTDDNITVYTTKDFVIAPQMLQENEDRPRLRITLKNGTVYSGIIPYAMTVTDFTHPEGYPMTLSLMKEHILIIKTLVTEDPPELVFMPVYVVEWVDKGEFFIDGHQAGLYSADEFYKLIGYYQSNNEYQLLRYGTYSESEKKWHFVCWNSFTLEKSNILGEMVNGPNFDFNFNGYTIFVQPDSSEPEEVTETELYNLVKGNL